MEKDTLFGLPKTNLTLRQKFLRKFKGPSFDELLKNQLDEDLERYTVEMDTGMTRYMADSDREHRRVHDMQYLCQLKTKMWAAYLELDHKNRFVQGMCFGAMLVALAHLIPVWVKWVMS